jgi:hypothetical protein
LGEYKKGKILQKGIASEKSSGRAIKPTASAAFVASLKINCCIGRAVKSDRLLEGGRLATEL